MKYWKKKKTTQISATLKFIVISLAFNFIAWHATIKHKFYYTHIDKKNTLHFTITSIQILFYKSIYATLTFPSIYQYKYTLKLYIIYPVILPKIHNLYAHNIHKSHRIHSGPSQYKIRNTVKIYPFAINIFLLFLTIFFHLFCCAKTLYLLNHENRQKQEQSGQAETVDDNIQFFTRTHRCWKGKLYNSGRRRADTMSAPYELTLCHTIELLIPSCCVDMYVVSGYILIHPELNIPLAVLIYEIYTQNCVCKQTPAHRKFSK